MNDLRSVKILGWDSVNDVKSAPEWGSNWWARMYSGGGGGNRMQTCRKFLNQNRAEI